MSSNASMPPIAMELPVSKAMDGTVFSEPKSALYDRVWHIDLDSDMSILRLWLSYSSDVSDQAVDSDSIGSDLTSFFRVKEDVPQLAAIKRQIRGGNSFEHLPLELIDSAGGPIHYLVSGKVMNEPKECGASFTCRVFEVTSRVLSERAHTESAAYFSAMLNYSPNYVVVKDLEGRYVQVNPQAEKVLGVSAADVVGKLPQDVLGPDIAAECSRDDFVVLDSEQGVHLDQEFMRDGCMWQMRIIKFPAFDASGCVIGLCAIGSDVTKYKSIERQLYHESNYDLLTEVPNRFLCTDRLQQAIILAKRRKGRVGLIILDLGKFSAINDAFGADCGDQILIETAWRLRACTRESDTIARLSGDQFALVVGGIDHRQDLDSVAEKVFSQLRLAYQIDDRSIGIAPSIGASIFPDDATTPSELISNGESALAHAKQGGRNTIKSYDCDISEEIGYRHRISTLLSHAVAHGELHVVYQPLIDPQTGGTVSAEALLRWECAELGPIGPDRFIPIAEENGYIHEIGEWVLNQACRAAAEWNSGRSEGIPVAVNVSPKQVIAYNFIDIVERALRDAKLDPALLKLEITETAFASDAERFQSTFFNLSDMGIALSLDDFGTGYSSLGFLSHCPFDVIKIDKTFLSGVNQDPESRVLLENIVHLAKSMKLTVVAEGVESDFQADVLRDLRCDQLQGYRFSMPLTEKKFVHFIDGDEAAIAA